MAYSIILIASYVLFAAGILIEIKNEEKTKLSCILEGVSVAFWLGGAISKGQAIFAVLYTLFLLMNIFDFLQLQIYENEDYQEWLNQRNENSENPDEIFKKSQNITIKWGSSEEEFDNFFEFTIPMDYFVEKMEITKDEIADTIKKMTGEDAMRLYDRSVEDKVIIEKNIYTIYKETKEKNDG